MNNGYDGYGTRRSGYRSAKPEKRRNAGNGGGGRHLVGALVVALLLVLWGVAIYYVVTLLNGDNKNPPEVTTAPPAVTTAPPDSVDTTDAGTPDTTTAAPDTEPVPDEHGISFIGTPVASSGIYSGNLILVNNSHPYNYAVNTSTDGRMQNFYDFWYAWPKYSYKLRWSTIKLPALTATALSRMFDEFYDKTGGDNSYMVTSGYRSLTLQQETLDEKIKEYGSEAAALRYCARPGYSEHHTGLAFDCYIYVKNDKQEATYKLGAADMPDLYNWIYSNCYRFGFVRRYTAAKSAITGFADEGWHFRYVGYPHAYMMQKNNYCLEEYIDYLHDYTYDNCLLIDADDGNTYAVYYEKAQIETVVVPEVKDENGNVVTPATVSEQLSEKTTLHIPLGGLEYEVSGDNFSGFIVTVKLG